LLRCLHRLDPSDRSISPTGSRISTPLLRGLGPDDWGRPTACALWTVKDIAEHLLDGNLRRLWFMVEGDQALDSVVLGTLAVMA
jgi:hypothetical protein